MGGSPSHASFLRSAIRDLRARTLGGPLPRRQPLCEERSEIFGASRAVTFPVLAHFTEHVMGTRASAFGSLVPRTNVNGRRVAAYERLQEALPGDVVFNDTKGNFRAASTVLTRGVPTLRPYGEPEDGQVLRLDLREFAFPIPYTAVPQEMRARMIGRGLPFVGGAGPKSGQIRQQYFSVVPDELAAWLLVSSRADHRGHGTTHPNG